MSDHEPTPDRTATPATAPTTTPTTTAKDPRPVPVGGRQVAPPAAGLPVAYELRRGHDGSVISGHCSVACADFAMFALSTAEAMGTDNPPGPLEWLRISIHRAADDAEMMWTHVLTPLAFPPPPEEPKHYLQWQGPY